ncbi:MAG: S8 family serine peptidase [Bacteroidota bacterium]
MVNRTWFARGWKIAGCLIWGGWLIGALPLLAQSPTSVNVKLRPSAAALEQQLKGIANRPSGQLDTQGRPPLLQDILQVRPLRKSGLAQAGPGSPLDQWYTLDLKNGTQASSLINQLRNDPGIEAVEPVRTYQLDGLTQQTYTPNDDSLSSQWYLPFIKAYDAWDISRGKATVKIGVIDTGLDYDHPEFAGQLMVFAAEDRNGNGSFEPWDVNETRNGVSGDQDGIDNDGNGYIDDVIGYDFTDQQRTPTFGDYVFPDPDPRDDNAHGTIVSGVISARIDNQIGTAGLAPNCKLMVIRAFSSSGAGEDDDIARAIVYAVDNGVDVLNFSFGDIYPSLMMHEAVKYAYARGVIMIASAGNGKGDQLHYPSGFSEVMSIVASSADLSTEEEFRWPVSSFGLSTDLSAPGVSILTPTLLDTLSDGTIQAYTRSSGTSLAAPMVSAAAALLLSEKGPLTPQQIRGILTTTADDLSRTGWDHFTGAGRLNLLRALQAVGTARVEIQVPETDRGSAADSIPIVATVLDPELRQYSLEYQLGIEGSGDWIPILENQAYQVVDDTLAWWDLRNLPEGDYTLRLRVDRSNGFTLEDRIRFVRDTTPPEVTITRASMAWDNQARKALIIFRSDDQALQTLYFRRQGRAFWQKEPFDRTTRNGDFLLDNQQLSPGTWEMKVVSENMAGLVGESPIQTLTYEPFFINLAGFEEMPYKAPMGRLLEKSMDLDGDGLQEIALSEFDNQLGFGPLRFYEFRPGGFVKVDSVPISSVMIPKDLQDSDGDGLQELLCSVNDSMYLVEQATPTAYPSEIMWRNEGNGLYAANFGDTDADGQLEILVRDTKDFYVFDGSNGNFASTALLENVSPNAVGPGLTRALVEDFDGDGKPEIIFGDNDADVQLYEYTAGSQYALGLSDTSTLATENAEVYLASGDFDGDGRAEFFIAIHTSNLSNADEEYDTPRWILRIFKGMANDQWEVVWEDVLYDIDSKSYNAVTVGNLDQDAQEEIVFTTFPRTYIFKWDGTTYRPIWFHFGDLATHHVIGDFNGNGIAEVGIGRGDSTVFFEQNFLYTGPAPITSLQGKVLGASSTRLDWQPSPGAVGYQVWRVPNYPLNTQAAVFGPITQNTFTDTDLTEDIPILYLVRSLGSNDTSGFGTAVFLRPHARPKIDSVEVVGPSQLAVYFSEPVVDRQSDKSRISLNGDIQPVAIIGPGDRGQHLILSFTQNFRTGLNQLRIDTTFQDADGACLDPAYQQISFTYDPSEDDQLFLTSWEILGPKEAKLVFNYPLDESTALDTAHYELSPMGSVAAVDWASDDMDAVKVTLGGKVLLGALGYPLSVTVTDVCAIQGTCIGTEGNTATFSAHKDDLSEVYAYPNPVRKHALFDGMRFANLTQTATIEVMTVTGRFVNRLQETDGDGGYEWNLQDQRGSRIKPGVYIYRVFTDDPNIEEFIGKFSLVE